MGARAAGCPPPCRFGVALAMSSPADGATAGKGGSLMLHREEGGSGIVFECDRCRELLATETHNLGDALHALRGAGWRSIKVVNSETWEHFCEACRRR